MNEFSKQIVIYFNNGKIKNILNNGFEKAKVYEELNNLQKDGYIDGLDIRRGGIGNKIAIIFDNTAFITNKGLIAINGLF